MFVSLYCIVINVYCKSCVVSLWSPNASVVLT